MQRVHPRHLWLQKAAVLERSRIGAYNKWLCMITCSTLQQAVSHQLRWWQILSAHDLKAIGIMAMTCIRQESIDALQWLKISCTQPGVLTGLAPGASWSRACPTFLAVSSCKSKHCAESKQQLSKRQAHVAAEGQGSVLTLGGRSPAGAPALLELVQDEGCGAQQHD